MYPNNMTEERWFGIQKFHEKFLQPDLSGNSIAYYSTVDLPLGNRLHIWKYKSKTIYALGNGPIKYIYEKEAILLYPNINSMIEEIV
jgi:hypothetical protein